MSTRLIDVDPLNFSQTWYHSDPVTGDVTIEERFECEPIIEFNKRSANDTTLKADGIRDSWWHVARIPNGVAQRWYMEEGINIYDKRHWDRVRSKLNDPDWRYLRTSTGRV